MLSMPRRLVVNRTRLKVIVGVDKYGNDNTGSLIEEEIEEVYYTWFQHRRVLMIVLAQLS